MSRLLTPEFTPETSQSPIVARIQPLTPATFSPEPSQTPDVAQSRPLTPVSAPFSPVRSVPEIPRPEPNPLIIRLPARRPLSPSPSFRNVRPRLNSDLGSDDACSLLCTPDHPETGEEDSSGAACGAQSPHLRLRPSKSGPRCGQGGAPVLGNGDTVKECNRGGVGPPASCSLASESRNPLFPESDEELWEGEQGDAGCVLQTLHLLSHAIPVPEVQFLPPRPKLLLLALGVTCDSILAAREENLVSQIVVTLQGKANEVGHALIDNSLESLVERCFAADLGVTMNDFVYMITTINLRSAVLRYTFSAFLSQFRL